MNRLSKNRTPLRKRHFAVVITFFLYITIPHFIEAETLSLSTYYPSPFGVYNLLRLVPLEDDPPCNKNLTGSFFVNKKGELNLCWKGKAENLLAPLIRADEFQQEQIEALWNRLSQLTKEIMDKVHQLLEPLQAKDKIQEQRIQDLEKELADYKANFDKQLDALRALSNACLNIDIHTTCPDD